MMPSGIATAMDNPGQRVVARTESAKAASAASGAACRDADPRTAASGIVVDAPGVAARVHADSAHAIAMPAIARRGITLSHPPPGMLTMSRTAARDSVTAA